MFTFEDKIVLLVLKKIPKKMTLFVKEFFKCDNVKQSSWKKYSILKKT